MKKYTKPYIRISKFGMDSISAADPMTQASMVEPQTYDMWQTFYAQAAKAEDILQYDNRTYIW